MQKHILTCFLIQLCLFGSTLKAQSKVAESPPGTDLVYQPGFPGQEGLVPSARLGEGTLYFELSKSQDLDSLTLRFWDHLISERMNVTPGTKKMVPGAEGNMFEGSFRSSLRPFPNQIPMGIFLSIPAGIS